MTPTPESTAAAPDAMTGVRARQLARRRVGGLVAVAVLVGATAVGLLGPGHASTTGSGPLALSVAHPRVLLSGTAAPLHIAVAVPPSTRTVSVELCREFVDHLDFQNWYPNPSAESGTPNGVRYDFDVTDPQFEVRLDARSQPNLSPGRITCTLTVETASPALTQQLTFTTWILP